MCPPLLWPENKIIQHIVDIQDYLLLFASLCATKKEVILTSLERKTETEPWVSFRYVSVCYGILSVFGVTDKQLTFCALLHFYASIQRYTIF